MPLPVPDEVRTCPSHGERQVIGYDITETLMFERPQLWVAVRKYPEVCLRWRAGLRRAGTGAAGEPGRRQPL